MEKNTEFSHNRNTCSGRAKYQAMQTVWFRLEETPPRVFKETLMNTLDIARAFFARTWKFLAITVAAIALLTASLSVFGFGGTIGLLTLVGLYLAVWFKGTEIYFWVTKRTSVVAEKVSEWWAPIWEDITGEAKAVAKARADYNSAKAARKAAKQELKKSRKAVKTLAKDAAKALRTQLIAAGNGDEVSKLAVDTLKTRKVADEAVAKARSAKVEYDKAFVVEYIAKVALHDAVESYRNGKSAEVPAS